MTRPRLTGMCPAYRLQRESGFRGVSVPLCTGLEHSVTSRFSANPHVTAAQAVAEIFVVTEALAVRHGCDCLGTSIGRVALRFFDKFADIVESWLAICRGSLWVGDVCADTRQELGRDDQHVRILCGASQDDESVGDLGLGLACRNFGSGHF